MTVITIISILILLLTLINSWLLLSPTIANLIFEEEEVEEKAETISADLYAELTQPAFSDSRMQLCQILAQDKPAEKILDEFSVLLKDLESRLSRNILYSGEPTIGVTNPIGMEAVYPTYQSDYAEFAAKIPVEEDPKNLIPELKMLVRYGSKYDEAELSYQEVEILLILTMLLQNRIKEEGKHETLD